MANEVLDFVGLQHYKTKYDEEIKAYIKTKEVGLTEDDVNNLIDEKLVPVNDNINDKVDKVEGMGLSTNDYSDIDKNKLSTISEGAEVNVQSDWNATDTTSAVFIKNKPTSLPANGGNSNTVNGHTVEVDVPSDAKFTDTVYDDTNISNQINEIGNKLDSHTHEISDVNGLQKAIAENLTARTEMVRSGTARPTAKGNALLERLTGDSWQRKLTGKNLYKVSTTLETTVSKGITRTPVYNTNGSLEYILLNGTATEIWSTSYWYRLNKAGTYIGSCCPSGGSINTYYCIFGKKKADGTYVNDYFDTGNGVTFTITDTEAEQGYYVELYINVAKGSTVSNLKFCPMVAPASETDQTYEPFCGNTPSPNPEFQQTIRSTGDMGWFDGEWNRATHINGVYTPSSIGLSSTNTIPCHGGDLVKVVCENLFDYVWVSFFDSSMQYISGNESLSSNNVETVAPSSASYFYINVQKNAGITPSTVGHVCVTINGKYAAIIDEVGKNLLQLITSTSQFTSFYNTLPTVDNGEIKGGWAYDFLLPNSDNNRIVSFKVKNADFVNMPVTIKLYERGNNASISRITKNCTNTSGKFSASIPKEATEVRIDFGNLRSSTVVYDLQIEIDNGSGLSTSYTPYTHKRTYIPLDEPLRAIGDVKDELVPVDGAYRRLKNIFRISLKSNASWELYFGTPGYFLMKLDVDENYPLYNVAKVNVMSNRYVGITRNKMRELNVEYDSISVWGGELVVRDTRFTDVSEFKAFLEKTEVIVDYVLDKPILSPFEDQTPFYNLQSFDEVTHASIAGLHENVEPTLTMRFPTSESGSIVTESWSKANLASYKMGTTVADNADMDFGDISA